MNILRLHPEGGGAPVTVDADVSRIGRDAGSDVHLRDASVSRQHAMIERRGEDWVVVDLGSGNGTRIDGNRVQEAALLPGQELRFGNLKFQIEIDRGNDGATMVLGRGPLAMRDPDKTMLSSGPPSLEATEGPEFAGTLAAPRPPLPPKPPSPPRPAAPVAAVAPPRRPGPSLPLLVVGAVVIGVGLAGVAWKVTRRPRPVAPVTSTPRPRPIATPTATPTPEPTLTPTPTPTARPVRVVRPTGTLLVSTDVDARVVVDGQVMARLRAGGLQRLNVSPGEHLVQFKSDEGTVEVVARVRVNEQTVVRRSAEAGPAGR